jgi:TldD protein
MLLPCSSTASPSPAFEPTQEINALTDHTDSTATPSNRSMLELRGVDRTRAHAILADALIGSDDGELYVERSESESLFFDDGRLKGANRSANEGFGLRVVAGEAVGYAIASVIDEAAIGRAAKTAMRASAGYSGLASAEPRRTNTRLYADVDPNVDPTFREKVALLEAMDAYARSLDPAVTQLSASLTSAYKIVEILRGNGESIRDVRPLVQIQVSVTLQGNGKLDTGSIGAGGRASFSRWIAPEFWHAQVDEAYRQARVGLDASPCPAGEMDVVIGPGWNGVLLHEAVGHGLEGDFNYRGSSAFSGRLGERVAAKGVTIFDDGAIQGLRGSLTVDDEGTPTSRTILVEDGILVGYMHDRMSARLMELKPTGNGRRESYAAMPMPRMTNTGMLAGGHKLEEMIASTRRGLYCVTLGGGEVDITNGKFVFQCTEAYLIEDGKITRPVKGATLIGDGPSALLGVTMIGDDFAFDPGMGVCGKNGQSIPVGVGQPSLKIKGLTVGGTEFF